jgi:hypothetical protein
MRKGVAVMAQTKSKLSSRERKLRAQCESCKVYDEREGRMSHHMGRETDWIPEPGYDPNLREFKCLDCGILFYKRCTDEELLDE